MSQSAALSCHDVSHTYANGKEALRAVNLELEPGKIHVIVGPNGAGKSTFMRIATTEIMPTQGQFYVLGLPLSSHQDALKRRIGVMPQQALLYKQLTAWEHVYLFTTLKGYDRSESAREAERVLKLLDLFEVRHEGLRTFSGGMLNAVNLAQALAGHSDILFLDEPTVGFDPKRRRKVWDHLKSLRGSKTIILTTQYLDEAHEIADNVVIFHHGRLLHQGSISSVLRSVGYDLRVELLRSDENLKISKSIEAVHRESTEDKITLWVGDGVRTLQQLLAAGIPPSNLSFQRPMLEDAYLNMIAGKSDTEDEQ